MKERYIQVVMEKQEGRNRVINPALNPDTFNFRIVSHHGERDWSPYGSLWEMLERFDQLPEREDGYFKLVEG